MTDACERGVGTVLYKKIAGKLVTVCCASATLIDAKAKYAHSLNGKGLPWYLHLRNIINMFMAENLL